VSVVAKFVEETGGHFGWLAPFVSAVNPVSSQRTRELLAWQPKAAMIDLRHRLAELFQDWKDGAPAIRRMSPSWSGGEIR